MSNENREIIIEKIKNKIYKDGFKKEFSSFVDLCIYFEIIQKGEKAPGGNGKKALLKIFREFMIIENKKGEQKYKILDVFSSQKLKAGNKFFNSEFYPICIFLLVDFLEKNSKSPEEVCEFYSKRQISEIFGLCNIEYLNFYADSVGKYNLKLLGCTNYIEGEIVTCISKQTNNMLDSAKSKKMLAYDETLCVLKDKVCREANAEEKNNIMASREKILKKHKIESFNKIQFRKNRKKIYKEINEDAGCNSYNLIKFDLDFDFSKVKKFIEENCEIPKNVKRIINHVFCEEVFNKIASSVCEHKEFDNLESFLDDFAQNGVRVDRNIIGMNVSIEEFKEVLNDCINGLIRIDEDDSSEQYWELHG